MSDAGAARAGGAPVTDEPAAGWLRGVAALHPAYFALVMATGIISVEAHLLGYTAIGLALLWANTAFFIVLVVMTGLRAALFGRRLLADLLDHGRCVGFFTAVAGTCVLGSEFLLLMDSRSIATGLWVLGVVLWCVLTYAIFAILTVKANKPPLPQGIHGGWLVAVVATQSVSVLGSQLATEPGAYREGMLLFTLMMWLGGGMLYIWIISLIFYRYMFFALEPSDLAPPYWINMGAMAISTLAGTTLIAAAPGAALLRELLPFLKGLTLLWWATASWWIPMLVILGFWRHGYRRFPLRYDPLYWGAIFPLGMYAACTLRAAEIMGAPALRGLAEAFFWIGLSAWGVALAGLVRAVGRGAWRGGAGRAAG